MHKKFKPEERDIFFVPRKSYKCLLTMEAEIEYNERKLWRNDLIKLLEEILITKFPLRNIEMFLDYFFRDDNTYYKLSQKYNLSRERIRQIIEKQIRYLRIFKEYIEYPELCNNINYINDINLNKIFKKQSNILNNITR
jgi:hypothetical protein